MRAASVFALVMLCIGCAEPAALLPRGGSCVRASQCMPGLVCVLGACSDDLSGLEGGVVPSMDAGDMEVDAGDMEVDAGDVMMVDAGDVDSGPPPPPMDAGDVDSGPPMMDAGFDSGPPPMMDAGFDSGPPPMPDAGFDAGFDAGVDAGPPPPVDAGP